MTPLLRTTVRMSCFILLVGISACKKEAPTVAFEISKSAAEVGEVLTFTNQSINADSYSWDFGDGSSSTTANPTHAYNTDGVFTVVLNATGEGGTGSASNAVTISYPAPVAAFSASKTSVDRGEEISFTNQSSNALSYSWNFGDGNTSTLTNPKHSYSDQGTYTVELTATGNGGTDTQTLEITVSANFAANIYPGLGAMGIELAESWSSVQNKLDPGYTQYGPLMISGSGGTIILHPIESESEGIMLYLVSVAGSMELSGQDQVLFIFLGEVFLGQTELGIKMGSTKSEVEAAYGTPFAIDTEYNAYEYDPLGIDFYFNSSSECDEMFIYPITDKKGASLLQSVSMNDIRKQIRK